MNPPSIAHADLPHADLPFEPRPPAHPGLPPRPMYWSVRRELWENRSLYLAPLAVTVLVLFATMISMIGLPRRMRTLPADPAQAHAVVVRQFSIAPTPIMLATFLVGMYYALDALYGERRDRSILFWKSLPVSDRTTVLSKAAIPLMVLPLIGLALSLATQIIILALSTVVLLASGMSPATLWVEWNFIQGPMVMLYGLGVHVLWFAPIYGWLLLVSAWARRTPLLWATLPLLAIGLFERMAFGSRHFVQLLQYRLTGAMTQAFAAGQGDGRRTLDRLTQLDPMKLLATPGLWIGLGFATVCLAVAVRLRRNREPI
jgi:ABC-2 type transport system permease protein